MLKAKSENHLLFHRTVLFPSLSLTVNGGWGGTKHTNLQENYLKQEQQQQKYFMKSVPMNYFKALPKLNREIVTVWKKIYC